MLLGLGIVAVGTAVVGSFALRAPVDTRQPAPTVEQQTVLVRRGDLRSVVTLDGAAVPVTPFTLDAPIGGIISAVIEDPSSGVAAGDLIAEVTGADGRTSGILAPEAGAIVGMLVAPGDKISATEPVATFAPRRFEALAQVPAPLLYRFYDTPAGLLVRIDRGPAPFECPLTSLGATVAPGTNPLDAPIELRCAIPSSIRVFAGVRLTIAAVTDEAVDALLIPVQSVVGTVDQGIVSLVTASGPVARSVRLGITDGASVVVLDGLEEGDQILDPPAADLTGPFSSPSVPDAP